ncbi:MAG: glycosyltransferase family 25 protein [Pseudomonadota bacterium]
MTIPGWYINLARDTARAEHMGAEAAQKQLPIQRQEAVDGALLTDAECATLDVPAPGLHRLSAPELACCMSHRRIWAKIANGDSAYGAVFEDDLTFANDTSDFLRKDGWLPDGAHLVKIETTARKVLLLPPFAEAGKGRALAMLGSRHLGAGGYIVSKTFAAELLAASETWSAPVDYLLFDPEHALVPDRPAWQLSPALCVQQVRSQAAFLPPGTALSGLDSARSRQKRRGASKVIREATRPFTNLATEIRYRTLAARSGGKWGTIPYRQ